MNHERGNEYVDEWSIVSDTVILGVLESGIAEHRAKCKQFQHLQKIYTTPQPNRKFGFLIPQPLVVTTANAPRTTRLTLIFPAQSSESFYSSLYGLLLALRSTPRSTSKSPFYGLTLSSTPCCSSRPSCSWRCSGTLRPRRLSTAKARTSSLPPGKRITRTSIGPHPRS